MNQPAALRRRLFLFVCVLSSLSFLPALDAQDKTRKPLRWGADADGGIPYVFQDSDDPTRTIGFEYELAMALAREMGRPIEFKQRAFESLIADVERGDVDLAMNGIEILPERLDRVRFTNPYYLYHLQLVTRNTEDRFTTLEEAKAKKLTIGTLGETAAEWLLKKMDIATKSYADQQAPYDELRDKVIDGVLLDLPAAIYYAAPDPSLKYNQRVSGLKFAGQAFAEGYYGIAVHKDNEALVKELNQALDSLQQKGELRRILQKWEVWTPDQYRLYQFVPETASGGGMNFSQYLPMLLAGAGITVLLTVASFILAMLLGLLVAIMRLYGPAPIRFLAITYVEFFRGIPVLLLLYFLYYGLPVLVPGLKLDAFLAAVLGFGLNYAAYEAEIYRGGISSIPPGQWEAAASLGMSPVLTFRQVILPQAIRVILPPMTNDLVALFKDTSVVSIIAVVELSKTYQILTKSGGGYLQIGLTTALLYLIMSVPLGYLSRYLEIRWGVKH